MRTYVVKWHMRDKRYDFGIYLGGVAMCANSSENGKRADAEEYFKSLYELEPGDTFQHKGSKPPD